MTASAQGIDVSGFQAPLTEAELAGLDFAYCKATEGLSITDPDLGVNWGVLGQWGKPRGAYHEFVPSDDPSAQARYCHQAVVNAGGFRPGDFVSVVASDYAGTTGAEVAAFCAEMNSLAGPQVIALVYSDLSVLPSLGACTRWPLWVTWPSATAPSPAQVAPWGNWAFWQYGIQGTDRDAFNGTAADLSAWIATMIKEDPVTVAIQNGWAFCGKCTGMFYAGVPQAAAGVCPAGGQHTPPAGGSFDYQLVYTPPGS